MGKTRRSISNLPEEILVDIFHRLPAKCVGQCRCVSSGWRALLSQPQFIRTHLHRTMILRRESLILTSDSKKSMYYARLSDAHYLFDEIAFSPTRLILPGQRDSSMPFYTCCHTHGLLLVEDSEGKKLVLNPITKEIKEIPRALFADDVVGHGLGYDSASDDYKVVALSHFDADLVSNRDKMFVYICSLKNPTLKKAEDWPYDHRNPVWPSGVFVHGYIHWIAWSNTDSKFAIVAFDLVEEQFCNVPPVCSIDGLGPAYLGVAELGGCLCMFEGAHIWVMKEYGVLESWTKFTVNNERARLWFVCSLGKEQMVMKTDKGFGPLVISEVLYNLKHGTSKVIVIDGDSNDFSIEMSFVESLVSPPRSNEKGRC